MKNVFLFLAVICLISCSTDESNDLIDNKNIENENLNLKRKKGKPSCGFGYEIDAYKQVYNGSMSAFFEPDFSSAVIGFDIVGTIQLRAEPFFNCGAIGESAEDYGISLDYSISNLDLMNGTPLILDHQDIGRKSFKWRLTLDGTVGTGADNTPCYSQTEWECFTFSY